MPRTLGSKAPRRSPVSGAKPGPKSGPRVEQFRFSLDLADADRIRQLLRIGQIDGPTDLADALRRASAAHAADAVTAEAQAALLVEVAAWDGKEIL